MATLPSSRVQVVVEPVSRQLGNPFERAGFLKQMSSPGDNGKLLCGGELRQSCFVHSNNGRIVLTDKQQRGSLYMPQCFLSQVGPPPAGDYRAHSFGILRGSHKGSGSTRAGSKVARYQRVGLRVLVQPVGCSLETLGLQGDIDIEAHIALLCFWLCFW